jgi:GNAT superfamily N-acetyltransferase
VTSRILPLAEWGRLGETELPKVLPYVKPEDAQIVVVEDDGRIVGCWAVLRIVHLEGVWIAPAYRGRGSVARRLLAKTLETARAWAGSWAMTGADTDEVRRLIEQHLHGVKVPMDTYLVPMEGTSCR